MSEQDPAGPKDPGGAEDPGSAEEKLFRRLSEELDWSAGPEREVPLGLVARRWSFLLGFDLVVVAPGSLVAVTVGRRVAVGTWVAFTLLYVFWLRRRMPRSPGHKAAGILAGVGYAILILGAGDAAPRIYLDTWGKEGTATVVGQNTRRTRDGGKDYTCTVTLTNGDSRELQASSDTCECLEPLVEDQVPVVYEPGHVVLPVAGTKGQLGTAKGVLPCGIGLLLVVTGAAHAVGRTAAVRRERLRWTPTPSLDSDCFARRERLAGEGTRGSPYAPCSPYSPTTASASISIRNSGATSAVTWTAEDAGRRSSGMWAARAARMAGRWAVSVTK
ncbi:hypothetical protein M878_08010 [Streptomyces roseochromogenus subsp. oscitans DS 12.976]|uniref:DUF3592 domain-containing protein n=1 Tax=Streptomyces roseochromogenus subsp. oscitans DS 12.976 TaxID=1352936 RepID=V6L193_STRRC|nr:hypothetical protein M878_08010 [Streptomyces roseochromogenus subsp. oscitans DS 12.976]